MPSKPVYWVYILECSDASFYIGSTGNLPARLEAHQSGNGPSHTMSRRPVRLVYSERFATLDAAVRRERQIKGWTRAKKMALIERDLSKLHELSKRSNSPAAGDW